LVSGISDLAFLYTDLPDNQAPLDSNFVTPDTGFSWNNARAVRTTIVMNSGFQASFTSTSRGVTIGNSIIVTQ
jgi:hypothetical protein